MSDDIEDMAEIRAYLCRRASDAIGRAFDRRAAGEGKFPHVLSWAARYNMTPTGKEQIVETTIPAAETTMEWHAALGGYGFLLAVFSDAPIDNVIDLDVPCMAIEATGELIPGDIPEAEL